MRRNGKKRPYPGWSPSGRKRPASKPGKRNQRLALRKWEMVTAKSGADASKAGKAATRAALKVYNATFGPKTAAKIAIYGGGPKKRARRQAMRIIRQELAGAGAYYAPNDAAYRAKNVKGGTGFASSRGSRRRSAKSKLSGRWKGIRAAGGVSVFEREEGGFRLAVIDDARDGVTWFLEGGGNEYDHGAAKTVASAKKAVLHAYQYGSV